MMERIPLAIALVTLLISVDLAARTKPSDETIAGDEQSRTNFARITQSDYDLQVIPLMQKYADERLHDYIAEVADKKFPDNDEELGPQKSCLIEAASKDVYEELNRHWQRERFLRDSLFGIFLSTEAAAGIGVGGEAELGVILLKTVDQNKEIRIKSLPVMKIGAGVALGAAFKFNFGLFFIKNGRSEDLTVGDISDNIIHPKKNFFQSLKFLLGSSGGAWSKDEMVSPG